MLRALRKSDLRYIFADSASKSNGPFTCPECDEEVVLKVGKVRINHFAHVNPVACKFATGESETHRRCKLEIYQALLKHPRVQDVALELPLGSVRPDVSATINGIRVAIEVQISALSMETIIHRTQEYERKGVYVLWLPQWTPYLDGARYSPRLWEKWVHAAYFGRIYYWLKGLQVVAYHFDPHFTRVPRMNWYAVNGRKMSRGGYSRKSKRFRCAIRGKTLNLAHDFMPREREHWDGGSMRIPFAKLLIGR